jgi:hypothetical protein
MSDNSRPVLSRRQFLGGGLAWAACSLTSSSLWAAAQAQVPLAPNEQDCTRWALLSDTHIAANPENRYRGFYPYLNLQEVTGQIEYNLPDGLVITGDLARLRGQTAAYENLKALLTPLARQCPIHLGLGNHDDRDDFFHAFGDDRGHEAVEDKHVFTAEAGPVRLIVLDTLRTVNATAGKLGEPQRSWLETFLEASDDKPTILFLHHTLNGELLDTRRLFEIITPVSKIKAVVYGHSHRYGYSEVAGIHLINLPATGYNLSGGHPVGWVEARLTRHGGEFKLHSIGGDRRLEGHSQTLLWRT